MNAINELLSIMKTLRDPATGCPWDKKQSIASISAYTLEEVYEVLDSIEQEDMDGLCDELGDLLFHIVFYAQIASENGFFNFDRVVRQVSAKLRRRHPHVFSAASTDNREAPASSWEAIKLQERLEKRQNGEKQAGFLDGISSAMPAILRAEKLQKRAATVGFDWHELQPVLAKIEEEITELKAEIEANSAIEKLTEEMGDLLFSCVNLARHLGVSPESALRQSNHKFVSRLRFIEMQLAGMGLTLQDASLQQMDALWQSAKNTAPDSA